MGGLTTRQWALIAFYILLAIAFGWALVQDVMIDERLLRSR